MNPRILASLLAGTAIPAASGSTLLWADNFNVATTGNLDTSDVSSDPAGLARRTGLAATGIQSQSAKIQHGIFDNKLNFLKSGGSGAVRFQVSGAASRFDFASGAVGPEIATGGGVRVEFDWVALNGTSDNWVAFCAGIPASPADVPTRLNNGETDIGILFRFNGGTQVFNNGPSIYAQVGASPAKVGTRHVVIDYAFSSVADTTPVTMTASVDGHEVYRGPFDWNNNAGQLHFEFETFENTLIDGISFTSNPYTIAADTTVFKSGIGPGGLAATFSGLLGGAADVAQSYALVAGDSDTDNGKFQIVGDKLQCNGHDFTAAANGTQYRVRVRGTSSGATQTSDRVFVLTLSNDDDLDNILDDWELTKVGNLTDLTGLPAGPGPGAGSGNFDADGLSDLPEYTASATYPNISPILADTDGDGLLDGPEVLGTAGVRPVTNPTLADTDGDTLSDLIETHSGTFVGPADSGTNPIVADTDGDGAKDGYEAANTPPFNPFVDDSLLDTDGDNLNTAAELAAGTSVLLADTDGDLLNDDEELVGAGFRPATNPLRADSDFDGATDKQESNSGTFVNSANTGSNPILQDTDGDGARDGFEVDRGSDPTLSTSVPALPPGFKTQAITTDASSGISSSKTYTHAISGGGAATINGVSFAALTPALTPTNFAWTTGTFGKNIVPPINNGAWNPVNGGVTDPGLQTLFGGFTYSGSGGESGGSQTFTLSGLTPGKTYDVRLYTRRWGNFTTDSIRSIDLTYTNGNLSPVRPFGALMTDRPGIVLGNTNNDSAYYLNFTYTAQGSELVINAKVPEGSPVASGSYHLYGLTNEEVPAVITGVGRNGLGDIVIDFTGSPDRAYSVTKSPDLVAPFVPLDPALTATTNSLGVGQATIPAAEASEAKEFYRIED